MRIPRSCRPIFECGIIRSDGDRDAPASRIQCPERLTLELAKNDLVVDHDTDATGNCGIDGFLRSWRAVDKSLKPTHKNLNDQWKLLRRGAKNWLQKMRRKTAWGEMTVEQFCLATSGHPDFNEYLEGMTQPGAWVDTAFLHAMACANDVDVVLFQPQMGPVLLGISTAGGAFDPSSGPCPNDDLPNDDEVGPAVNPTIVPMALVNNVHFWGLLQSETASARPVEEVEQEEADDDDLEPRTDADEAYVQRELCFGMALAEWNPWKAPTQALVDAMQPLLCDARYAASDSIICRRAVLNDLALESVSAQDANEHLTYRRAVRWRLDRPALAWCTFYRDRKNR